MHATAKQPNREKYVQAATRDLSVRQQAAYLLLFGEAMDINSYNKESMMKRLLTLILLAMMSPTAQAAPPAEKPGQALSPETEMAIMRVMNLENRIQTLQTVPVKMTDNELAGHFSGTWICFTTMRLNGQLGRGIMQINLKQEGDELTGDGGQLKHPFDPRWPAQASVRPALDHSSDRYVG